MGIATSTALAIGGMAISAGTAGASFAQAGKQRKLQQQAQADAARALEEARRRTEMNVYKQLSINQAPYEMKSEALLSQGAQGVEALREGGVRGVAGGLGRLQAQQAQAQEENRLAYGQDISQIQNKIVDEEGRLRDINLQLDLGEIAGAQQAAADAAEKAAAANKAGFESATSAVKQGIETFVPLFTKQPTTPPYTGTPLMMQSAQNAPASPFNVNNILSPYMPNRLPAYNVQAPFLPSSQPKIPLMQQSAANPVYSFNPFINK